MAQFPSSTSASGIWSLKKQKRGQQGFNWPSVEPPPVGQVAYTTAGTYTWIAPTGVISVCVLCIGPGGQGGGYPAQGSGGGLGWKNNIPVVPGNSYTVVVGSVPSFAFTPMQSGDSYFINTSTVRGGGGQNLSAFGTPSAGGTYTGDGGGNGGSSPSSSFSYSGGGGAAGYTGNGGTGGLATDTASGSTVGTSGSGGGGGGGSGGRPVTGGGWGGGRGGGVGILGQGSNGTAGASAATGGDANGNPGNPGSGGTGATYGGGESGSSTPGSGAVRIIWGSGRSFPSTNTGNL
jgi:hypothetical protein